ncbi:MAG: hypothetical protein V1792_29810 [Pseudomonadota bacterium]
MSTVSRLTSIVTSLPPPVGKLLTLIPYGFRPVLGGVYRRRQAEIAALTTATSSEKEDFVLERMRTIVSHAWDNVPFYRHLYEAAGFRPERITCFDALGEIPLVTKEMLSACDLEERSSAVPGRYVANTGGSSGTPLSFYILPSSMGHEWAHMHHIWRKLGHSLSDVKLTFIGRNVGDRIVPYDALRHQFAVNIYRPNEEIAQALRSVMQRITSAYLLGYPSALYEFASYCESEDPELTRLLASRLRGGFLGSEYPAPAYRDKIESVFKIPTVSWYGHTERCVLAWEKEDKDVYFPFHSYGFAEAVRNPTTGRINLVGTSYYNTASPLIRYNTEDEISPLDTACGLLESFRVQGGRKGDYILDKNGKKIALTGLIFGRHHRMFGIARFVQIAQREPGKAVLYVTIADDSLPLKDYPEWFDLSDVEIDFVFRRIDSPILTESGKVILNVSRLAALQDD